MNPDQLKQQGQELILFGPESYGVDGLFWVILLGSVLCLIGMGLFLWRRYQSKPVIQMVETPSAPIGRKKSLAEIKREILSSPTVEGEELSCLGRWDLLLREAIDLRFNVNTKECTAEEARPILSGLDPTISQQILPYFDHAVSMKFSGRPLNQDDLVHVRSLILETLRKMEESNP